MLKPELLSPTGTLKNIRCAFAHGADTAYTDQSRYSLCMCNDESNHENFQLGINGTHALGEKSYVVVSTASHNAKPKTFIRNLKPVVKMGPDALTMFDPGLIMLVREYLPEIPIHLSVRANAVNWATVKFWQQTGLTCVVLSHELSLEEIEEIHNQTPDMEIEIFVHDALRMAYSGRCLPSNYINKCSPDQDTCTSACRWGYNVQEGKEDDVGSIVHKYEPVPVQSVEPTLGIGAPIDKVFITERAQHSGRYTTTFEDEHGTCVVNSKDLRVIAHVECLIETGVHSLRTKSCAKSFHHYAYTVQVYRRAIDDATAGKLFSTSLLEAPRDLAHCGYTEGFLRRHTHSDYQNYEHGYSISGRQQFVGKLTGEHKGDLAAVAVRNKLSVGDSLELMMPQGNINFTFECIENARGRTMPVAPGDGYTVWPPVLQDLELNYTLPMCNFSGETTCNSCGK